MPDDYVKVSLHVFYNEDGDCGADEDEDTARECLTDNYNSDTIAHAVVTLELPTPRPVKVELTARAEKQPQVSPYGNLRVDYPEER